MPTVGVSTEINPRLRSCFPVSPKSPYRETWSWHEGEEETKTPEKCYDSSLGKWGKIPYCFRENRLFNEKTNYRRNIGAKVLNARLAKLLKLLITSLTPR